MANFNPLKRYLILLIDELEKKYGFSGPFLDAGCGTGYCSLHFDKKGWKGLAVDLSEEAIEEVKKQISPYKENVSVQLGNVLDVNGKFNTIFACDILEHIQDDNQFIKSLKKNMTKDSKIVITVSLYKKEWRWDDEFYGHIRRYEVEGIKELMARNGFVILDIWDYSYPFLWFLRRFYTLFFPKGLLGDRYSKQELTNKSALQNAYGKGTFITILEKIICWNVIFWVQNKFRKYLFGYGCILVGKIADE